MSLSGFGDPVELAHAGGWILVRSIPGTSYRDAMGPYPLFSCLDWSALCRDVDDLPGDIVSLTLIPDPFGGYSLSQLHKCFERVDSFKERFVVDLAVPMNARVSPHHRRVASKALRLIEIEVCDVPLRFLDEWTTLYGNTIRRHRLDGIKAFSRSAFARQLAVPGIVMFRAVYRGETAGINLWFAQGGVAYGHLAGISDTGYGHGASYALYWFACEWFSGKVDWLDLGGVSGAVAPASGGLDYFKRGWSTGTRKTYLCGRILNRNVYNALTDDVGASRSRYFPAYRSGELA